MGTNISAEAAQTALAGDVQHVLDGIRRIVQGLRESSRETERLTGLTAAQLYVLRRLAAHDRLSINELAAQTFTHQSSVSVVATRLAERRLVQRRADTRDARRRALALTTKGRRALRAAPATAQERLVSVVLGMSASKRRSVGRALTMMADAMVTRRRPEMFFEDRRRA